MVQDEVNLVIDTDGVFDEADGCVADDFGGSTVP
jgi:hypothetical protein